MINIQDVKGLSCDSRNIKPGDTFVAIRGEQLNGESFIDQAISNGAINIVLRNGAEIKEHPGINYYYVPEPRKTLAILANARYQPQPSEIVAVTGTNGKTSVAYFFMQMCLFNNLKGVSIGTLGILNSLNNNDFRAALTTPDPLYLNEALNTMALEGVAHVAIEASSHGLSMNRLDGIVFKAAGFTNLSRDHLDYHVTHEEYFAAKQRLFKELLPEASTAILNHDIPEYDTLLKICDSRNIKVISYGKNLKSDLRIVKWENDRLILEIFGKIFETDFHLLGDFQIYNALCALGMAISVNIPLNSTISQFGSLQYVPGRLEKVRELDNKAAIFVDYAHTPDALKNVLLHLKESCKGKIHLVFGCGGQRDKGKRPLMGATAQLLADYIIITDDNPRGEDASLIRADIREACPSASEIADRKLAIHTAINTLKENDFLLIAGKGHENYQIIGDKKHYFSDREVVEQYNIPT